MIKKVIIKKIIRFCNKWSYINLFQQYNKNLSKEPTIKHLSYKKQFISKIYYIKGLIEHVLLNIMCKDDIIKHDHMIEIMKNDTSNQKRFARQK
jgi:hypothetical protein